MALDLQAQIAKLVSRSVSPVVLPFLQLQCGIVDLILTQHLAHHTLLNGTTGIMIQSTTNRGLPSLLGGKG